MRTLLAICVLAFLQCGGSDSDPRCENLCESEDGEICSSSEVAQCKQDCGARIEGVSGICATCLVEDSYFGEGNVDAADCEAEFYSSVSDCSDVCGGSGG